MSDDFDRETDMANRHVGIGYFYGRCDEAGTHHEQGIAPDFGDFFVGRGADWGQISKIYDAFMAAREAEQAAAEIVGAP